MNRNRALVKAGAAVMTATMLVSSFAPAVSAAEDGAKYTVTETAYGFNKVEQTDGKTLTYSPDSGVTLLEDDGYAFKDLNQNGKLDTYEDWRLSTEERAKALAEMMAADGRDGIESIAGLMLYSAHTAVSSETVSGTELDSRSGTQDGTTTMEAITDNKLRHVLVTSIASPEIGAKGSNNLHGRVEGMV